MCLCSYLFWLHLRPGSSHSNGLLHLPRHSPSGGIYNPANTDMHNNPRLGYVGVYVVRPRAKLHLYEYWYNQHVNTSAGTQIGGLVAQFCTAYTDPQDPR
jgi:hypothetical protein